MTGPVILKIKSQDFNKSSCRKTISFVHTFKTDWLGSFYKKWNSYKEVNSLAGQFRLAPVSYNKNIIWVKAHLYCKNISKHSYERKGREAETDLFCSRISS